YTYDALDRLAQRNGTATAYADLSNNPIKTPTSAGDAFIVREPGGDPLSARTGTGAGQAVIADGGHRHGVATADPVTGALGASIGFDPFGQQAAATGSLPLGFQGGVTDPATGQTNMHARWYAPNTGAFTSRDTWTLNPSSTARTNRYQYVEA